MAFIICIYYINWSALKGFPSLRKTVSPHGKIAINFHVCLRYCSQSAADTSLAYFRCHERMATSSLFETGIKSPYSCL